MAKRRSSLKNHVKSKRSKKTTKRLEKKAEMLAARDKKRGRSK